MIGCQLCAPPGGRPIVYTHYTCGCPQTFGFPYDRNGVRTTRQPNNGPRCEQHGTELCRSDQ